MDQYRRRLKTVENLRLCTERLDRTAKILEDESLRAQAFRNSLDDHLQAYQDYTVSLLCLQHVMSAELDASGAGSKASESCYEDG